MRSGMQKKCGCGVVLLAVVALGVGLTAATELRAASCIFSDFTSVPQIPDPNYFDPRPYSLSPEPGGLWDCFAQCGSGSEIRVIDDPAGGGNQVVQITGGATNIQAARTLPTNCLPCADGTFTVTAKVKAGGTGGGGALWRLDIHSPNSVVLARWDGHGDQVRGRIGGTGFATPFAPLTGSGTWDTLTVHIDVDANTSEFFFNNTLLGVMDHTLGSGQSLAGDKIFRYTLRRVGNAGTAGHTVLLDDIGIENCRDCQSNVTPKLPKNVGGDVGGAVTPGSITYTIENFGTSSLDYEVAEADASGAATNHTWMSLNKTGPITLPTNGSSDTVIASFNTTGLSAGLYTGYIKFTDTCSTPLNSYLRQVNLFVGLPVSNFTDLFSYGGGSLDGNGGWVGGGTGIVVTTDPDDAGNQVVQVIAGTSGNSSGETSTRTVNLEPCVDGIITTIVRMKASTSGSGGNAWRLDFNDPSGKNLARWEGFYNTARGRTGGYAATPWETVGSDRFYELKAVIDTANKTTSYFFDGNATPSGVQRYSDEIGSSQAGIDNTIGQIRFERIGRSDLSGSSFFDDLQVVTCPKCGIQVVPDQIGSSGKGRVNSYSVFSAALEGNAAVPSEYDFFVRNVGSSPITYWVETADVSGTPTVLSWLTLDTSGTTLAMEEEDRVLATINATGLPGGEYVGFIKFTDTCSPANTYTLRQVKLVVVGDACLSESFSVPDGSLTSQAGWSGSAGTSINVVNGELVISTNDPGAGSADVYAVSQLPRDGNNDPRCPDCVGSEGIIASLKMKAGAGGSTNMWRVIFLDDGGVQLAQFWRTGTTVSGQVDGWLTGDVAVSAGTFDELEARINVVTQMTKFYINGVAFPADNVNTFNPIGNLGSTFLDQVEITRLGNANDGSFLIIDDIAIERCAELPEECSEPVFDVRDGFGQPDSDGFVTPQDYLAFEACATGPDVPLPLDAPFECGCMDINGDQAIDQEDFAVFQRCYSGAGSPADPDCAD